MLELLPSDQIEFQRMLDTIRRGYERFGFLPIETPTFELVDVLLTKSGGETEKQVYFVQSTGALEQQKKPELALRFDLTVPLARYVAEHEHELNFPFRRYQIQRVYRGERAQKGRFREFYQCDIDVVGKDKLSIAYDSEIPAVIYGVFAELGFGKFTIFVNNRKLLKGLLESMGVEGEQQTNALHEIDRLRKAGRAKVEELLVPICGDKAKALLDVLTQDWRAATEQLASVDNATLKDGIDELRRVYDNTIALGVPADYIKVDLSIVRGLDYYTGTVYETFLDDHPDYGSICSGGRYENLAGLYTKSKLPGVGISIGATRLFSQLMATRDKKKTAIAQAIILNVDPTLAGDYAKLAAELRAAGLSIEVYGDEDKLGKQFKYADRSGIPYAVIIGSRERDAGVVKIKDLRLVENNEREVPRADVLTALGR
ncbi:MAG: histidine--tRNA ligase [Kofleriaceae bacterium]